jgi:hypothetical protein
MRLYRESGTRPDVPSGESTGQWPQMRQRQRHGLDSYEGSMNIIVAQGEFAHWHFV